MGEWIWIGLAGGLGCMARYALASWLQQYAWGAGRPFPLGTLGVNVLGCLAIGFLMASFEGRSWIRPEVRLALTVGFLGGFTTFSTFGYETVTLYTSGLWLRAGLYIAASVLLGLLAVVLGHRLAQAVGL